MKFRMIVIAGINIILSIVLTTIQTTGDLPASTVGMEATIGKGVGIFLLLSAGYSIVKDRIYQKKNAQSQ